MLGLLLIILVSGFFSWLVLKNSYENRTLFNFNLIVLLAWYLPAFLSLILPFDHFGVKSISYPVTLMALSMINIVLFASVLANKKFKGKLQVQQLHNIGFQSLLNNSFIKKTSRSYHLFPYLIIAYIACLLEFIKKLRRGFSFSLDNIGDNRLISIEAHETDTYSLLTGLTSGFIYYLLFFSVSLKTTRKKNNPIKISINWVYLIPFIIYSILIFLSGKKSPIMYGLIIVVMKIVCFSQIKLNKIIVITLIGLILTTIFTTIQNQLRTTSLDSHEDQKQIMILLVETDENHPFIEYIQDSPPLVYNSLSTVYLYFGLEYDMLYATMSIDKNDYSVPPGFISFQPLYRVFSLILGGGDRSGYSQFDLFKQLVSRKYNAFSNVWGTFFYILYVEGGSILLLLFIPISFTFNYYYTYKYLSRGSENDQLALLLTYMTYTIFVMNTPFRNPAFLSMIVATVFADHVNYFFRSILTKGKTYKI